MALSSASAPVVLDRLTFTWPDGSTALDDISGAFGAGRTGLAGRNGSGKSTLLRLIAGELTPTSGRVDARGEIAYLPQRLTLDTDRRVAELLGVAPALDAVRAIESGDVDPRHFDAVGDDWDIEARSAAALAEAGLDLAVPERGPRGGPRGTVLDRRVGELSGGEAVLVAIAGIRLRRAPITLLDEPTNNLDRVARGHLAEMVRGWRGTLIVVSHDVALLELMDETAELYEHELSVFGGPYSEWRAWLDAEQSAAVDAERTAAQMLAREKRQRIEAETKLAHRERTGRKAYAEKRVPKIVMNARKRAAQVSAGRLRGEMSAKEESARAARAEAGRRIRNDDTLAIELPDPGVPRSRRIATLGDGERSWVIQGPERAALIGPNGAGKTTLLERLVADAAGPAPATGVDNSGAAHEKCTETGSHRADTAESGPSLRSCVRAEAHTDRVGYLPQRVDGLEEAASVLSNVAARAPQVPEKELRNRLARFLIRGGTADRPVSALSGGERFRVALAALLLADPAPQLVVLDEPSNNLDLDTASHLVEALRAYRGAVLIVSHDDAFLTRLGLDLTLRLDAEGRLTEVR